MLRARIHGELGQVHSFRAGLLRTLEHAGRMVVTPRIYELHAPGPSGCDTGFQ